MPAVSQMIGDGCILLADEPPLETAMRKAFEQLETSRGSLVVLEARELAAQLDRELVTFLAQLPQPLLCVFPGHGGDDVRRWSQVCKYYPCAPVFAKRLWTPGTDPVVMVGTVLTDGFVETRVKSVVVLDDVISSGATLRLVRERNLWKFPRAQWYGATWIKRAEGNSSGYREIKAVTTIAQVDGRKIPINSLSTLVRDEMIAHSFATRNFADSVALLRLLHSLA